MARILYGVHGTGHGHAVRALAVAQLCPEHEYLFVSHADGLALLRGQGAVHALPNPVTPVARHRVNLPQLALENARFRLQARRHEEALLRLADTFRPDFGMSDYEYLVPRACRRLGLPCLSVDNQHAITRCRHRLPAARWPEWWTTGRAIEGWFGASSAHVISTFLRAPLQPGFAATVLIPPILRPEIAGRIPQDDGHVIAYQGYSTFHGFLPMLRAMPRRILAYGLGPPGREGNCEFRRPSPDGLLADLASCAYVICGGGHTLISEALFLGKPVLSFPVALAFEQWLNAHGLEQMGYGLRATPRQAGARLIAAFEERLPNFRRALAQAGGFNGNPALQDILRHFARTGSLPPAEPSPAVP